MNDVERSATFLLKKWKSHMKKNTWIWKYLTSNFNLVQ